jgi:phenazine biosynthesis protein phzE
MTVTGAAAAMLGEILGTAPRPFALLHRPESTTGIGNLDLLVGTVTELAALAEIPWPARALPGRHDLLALLPYRLISERGYAHHDDGEPLLVLAIEGQAVLPARDVLDRLTAWPVKTRDGGFDIDDDRYADVVRRVVTEEIGTGEGANFVIKRTYLSEITNFSHRSALALFGRLLSREAGAYWCFLIHTGTRTFVGASPERHLSVHDGVAVMNPISGTYRYPAGGPSVDGLLGFLADDKEANELYMVLDEELKMMSRVCVEGVRVNGPRLKEMAHLAHTEYLIEGRSHRDFRDLLRETLFAPTVTGSPLESACRVITRHEPRGRGYYGGVAALLGRDPGGGNSMDSAIMIRTADIDATGQLRIGVGSTLVRDSDPVAEAAETRAKAAGVLTALNTATLPPSRSSGTELGKHPMVRRALAARNIPLAGFWVHTDHDPVCPYPTLAGRKLLIVDAEDTFTAMGAQLLRATGLDVIIHRFDEDYQIGDSDFVIVGPGPGDPREHTASKIKHLRALSSQLLNNGQPFLAVCLGHQVLCDLLGLELVRRASPNQGVQRRIDLFGTSELVYFYNTFTARSVRDWFPHPLRAGRIEVARDTATGEVYALRGSGLASVQFHPASVMTSNGQAVLVRLLAGLVTADARTDREITTPRRAVDHPAHRRHACPGRPQLL